MSHSSVSPDDVLILQIVRDTGDAVIAPPGWTQLRYESLAGSFQAVYYRVFDGTEGSSSTWSFTGPAADTIIQRYLIRGADPAAPFGEHGAETTLGATTITAPSVSVARTDALLLGLYLGNGGNTGYDPPAGMAEIADIRRSAISLYATQQTITSTGATGVRAATPVTPVAHDSVGISIVVQPPGGAPTPTPVSTPLPPGGLTAIPGGPLTIAEGAQLSLDGSASSGSITTWRWDLDNDGQYDDAIGETATVDWWRLVELGIDDDGSYPVGLEVDDGTSTATAATTLSVTNTEPTVTVDGSGMARAGGAYTVEVTVDDPGADTVTGWTIAWGDGTVSSGAGLPGTQTKTYATASAGLARNITVSVTDEDGTWIPGDLFVANFDDPDTTMRFTPETGARQADLATTSGALTNGRGVTIGPDGMLYVASYGTDRVVRYDPTTGAFLGTFVTAGSGGLDGPAGVAFGRDGNLYVSSKLTNRVLRYSGTTGAYLTAFVTTNLSAPTGMTFGPDGRLYVANESNDTVTRFNGTTGTFVSTFASPGAGTMPSDVAFGPDGNLYVSLFNASRVHRFNGSTGAAIGTFASTGLDAPISIQFGPDGALWVADYWTEQIRRYNGTTGALLDTRIAEPSPFGPMDLVFEPDHIVTLVTPFVVNDTGDAPDSNIGNGACATAGGVCTLRAAIQEANAAADPNLISFGLTGGPTWTISPTSALPVLTRRAVIDATTQPGWAGAPVVRLDGASAGGPTALQVSAARSEIRGLAITRWGGYGVLAQGAQTVVADNRIGVGTGAGGTDLGNSAGGVLVSNDDVVIDGNVISGNDLDGILVTDGSDRVLVRENLIGTDAAGTAALGNVQEGIQIDGGSFGNDGARIVDNVFVGNPQGIGAYSALTNAVIQGNIFGRTADGSTPIGTQWQAVLFIGSMQDVLIGGTGPGEGNLISSSSEGVTLLSLEDDIAIVGNRIIDVVAHGIDIRGDNSTDNDPGDVDTGPNDLLNHPEITSAVEESGTVTVEASLDVPAGTYRLEVYSNPTAANPADEADILVAATTVVHPGGGARTFELVYPGATGDELTMTATESLGAGVYGSTSEISDVAVAAAPPAPLEPVVLDRIQKGVTTIANGASSRTVAIDTVDVSRSILLVTARGDDNDPADLLFTASLSAPNTITLERVGTAGVVTVEWQVLSFVSGVRVQRGTTPMTSEAVDVPIFGVDTSRSFPITTIRSAGTTFGSNDFVAAHLPSPTSIRLEAVGTGATVAWQVVTYDEATVQTGTVAFGSTDASRTATVSAPSETKVWLLTSTTTDSGTPTNIAQKLVRGSRTNSTTLTFQRGSTGQGLSVRYHLVTFTDATTVQQGSLSLGTTTTTLNQPMSPVDPARSAAVGDHLGYAGRTTYTTDDNPGVAMTALHITSGSNVRIQRNLTGSSTLDLSGQVITWAGAGPNVVTVNSSGDGADRYPGDGYCDTGGDPTGVQCTLRAAIQEANANAAIDTIHFAIPGAGPTWTIAPGSALPTISAAVTLDGTTQTGWTSTPVVVLDGVGSPSSAGLTVTGADTVVRGFAIGRFVRGIDVLGPAGRTVIEANHIGVDAAGTSAFANTAQGLIVGAADAAIDGNVVSANGADGIIVSGGARARIVDNLIGTDVTGNVALPNGQEGVEVTSSNDVVIGEPGAGNVISGNAFAGINAWSSGSTGVVVQANRIGVGADGSTPLPNAADNTEGGITFRSASSGWLIGGTGPGEGNVIAHNTGDGVSLSTVNGASTGVAIVGNEIRDNTGLGIDHGDDDVTANDAGDVDTGSNDFLNFPVVTSAAEAAGTVTVDFTLDVPAGDYRIEAFTNPSGADPTGYGEGETFETATIITHTGGGSQSFQLTFPGSVGDVVTLAATRALGGGSYGSTSEFSAASTVASPIVVVNSTGDSGDQNMGNGVCETATPGQCTLRAAIQEANANPTIDSIEFAIPGAGPTWTISPTGQLPVVSAPVTIDATTQPGWVDDPIVVLSGASAGVADGFNISAGFSEIRGFVIVSFDGDGIDIGTNGSNTIAGNWIGIAADGTTAAGVTDDGIVANEGADANTIGGPGPNDGNVISANASEGILLWSNDNVVQGNRIGTDASGLLDRGNGDEGLDLNTAADTVVLDNVISGNNGEGIQVLSSDRSVFRGNLIGVGADGTTPVGNSFDGITMNFGDSVDVVVGGTGPGEGNTIANNGDEGVSVHGNGTDRIAALGNSIHSNAALGWDLGGDGVTNNDVGDGDSGPNRRLNFPVVTSASSPGAVATVEFTLDVPAGDYRIEAFTNPSGADPSGHGEGEVYAGATTITHPGGGAQAFQMTHSAAPGDVVTLTATRDLGLDVYGATSEFSASFPVALDAMVVNSTGDESDAAPGDGICDTGGPLVGGDPECTLRAAIEEANASSVGTIEFAIPGAGPTWTISPATVLPIITGPTVIDGTTQPGFTSTPVIRLDGAALSLTSQHGLDFGVGSDSSIVRGLAITSFPGAGIRLRGSDDHTIAGNHLGVTPIGTTAAGNRYGVYISGSSNSTIGGTTAADRNIISANTTWGVAVYNDIPLSLSSFDTAISGNYVGTDVTGTVGLGNGSHGLFVVNGSARTIVGGPTAAHANVIADNGGFGVMVGTGSMVDSVIENNIIGGAADGLTALPDNGAGVAVTFSSRTIVRDNVVLAAGGAGISLDNADDAIVTGNVIGTDVGGTVAGSIGGAGISVGGGVDRATIGGTAAADANTITNAAGDGVEMLATAGVDNAVLGNAISGNTRLGIDLSGGTENFAGATANDAGDGDSGPNELLNHPVITNAVESAGTVTVDFDLDVPAGTYRIEAFTNPSGIGLGGYGEAEVFESAATITHTGSGSESFQLTYTGTPDDAISLIATEDLGAGSFGSTSELSETWRRCDDPDGDGLCSHFEDLYSDTDGDLIVNRLDSDDDGDGTPTAAENADPNGDGDPRDGRDSDHDGQPDWLDAPTGPTGGMVQSEQKISDLTGGLAASLDSADRFGAAVAPIGDVDGDGIVDLAVGANADDDGGSNRGAVHILFMNPDGTVRAEQKISDTEGGFLGVLSSFEFFGQAVAGLGDLDGDGTPDLVVGAQRDDDGGTNRGAVHILFLNTDGTVRAEQKISDTTGGLVDALTDNNYFGTDAAGLGDLDGDGTPDLVVGAPRNNDGGTNRGAVHILFLNTDGTVRAEQTISDTRGGLTATLDDVDYFGWSVDALGDVDGDGTVDLAVGARFDGDGGTNRGAVHILFLNPDGTVRTEQKISDTDGGLTATLDDDDRFGGSVSGIGDLDHDGIPDVVVGADGDDDGGIDRGAAYVLFLNPDGTVRAEHKISSTAGGLTATLDDSDQFGTSVAGIGDLDGDGTIGLAISAIGEDDGALDAGAVYILDLTPGPFVVNSTGDAGDSTPGDGRCDTGGTNSDGDQACTLRAAIEETNAFAGADTIHYAIPATDPNTTSGGAFDYWTITPTTALPAPDTRMTIDATTQPGWAQWQPVVTIQGGEQPTGSILLLDFGSDDSEVAGLRLLGGPADAILVAGNGVTLRDLVIGVDETGAGRDGAADNAINVNRADLVLRDSVVSGSASDGIDLNDGNADRAVIVGNRIGTGTDGTGDVPFGARAIYVRYSDDHVIGEPGNGNVITNGAVDEVFLRDSTGTIVQGNLVGEDLAGTPSLGTGDGFRIFESTALIGGTGPGEGNTIVSNGDEALDVRFTTTVSILGNSLRGNGALGIDFGGNGVTPNDPGDVDAGPNDLLNFPEVTSALESGGTVELDFELDVPAGTYRVEFFANPSGADPSSFGEGEQFVHAVTVTHSGLGVESFTASFAGAPGDVVTATTTEDLGGGSYGSTSEFSAAATVGKLVAVNSTADTGDAAAGNGVCDTGGPLVGGDPECTLRAALAEINALGAGGGRITFAIPTADGGHSGGIWTITPGGTLPTANGIDVDATTQPGWAGDPIVVIDIAGGGGPGLVLGGANARAAGLSVINALDGISVGGTGGASIVASWIGIHADGTDGPNTGSGITVYAPDTTIDDVTSSNNDGNGVAVSSLGDRTVVTNSRFGTSPSGVSARPNGYTGIGIDGADDVVVGGQGAGNNASANGLAGVSVGSGATGTIIQANTLGTTVLPNGYNGALLGTGTGTLLGGTAAGEGNTIEGNTFAGVYVTDGRHAIAANTIADNGGLGIDVAAGVEDANAANIIDAGDGDTGANDALNQPLITAADVSGGNVTVDFDLDVPAGTYRIEAFTNPSGADPTGVGEGEIFQTATTVTHTGSGAEAFQIVFPGGTGEIISLTATADLSGGVLDVSSEFSQTFVSTGDNTAPVLDNSGTLTLDPITEDDFTNPGNTVAEILASGGGDPITDADPGDPEGIMITAHTGGTDNGWWEFSTDAGTSWTRLGWYWYGVMLRPEDRVRYVPAGYGNENATFTFRAWDQSSGTAGTFVRSAVTGGSSPYSTATETVSITATSVNDAPTFGVPASAGPGGSTDSVVAWDPDGRGADFQAVAELADGSIIIAGYKDTFATPSNNDVLLARFLPDGAVDWTFGNGGHVLVALGTGDDRAEAIAIDDEGRIVVAGTTRSATTEAFVARFLADGTLDTSFGGGDGWAALAQGGSRADDVAIQPDGSIVLAGGVGTQLLVARFDDTGTLDGTFGSGGVAVHPSVRASQGVALQTDGRIVVSTRVPGSADGLGAARLTAVGALDTTFDGDGIASTTFGLANSAAYDGDIAVQPDGAIVVTGSSWDAAPTAWEDDLARVPLVRFLPSGALDPTLGGGAGYVLTDVPGGAYWDGMSAVAVQPDGAIVTAGQFDLGYKGRSDVVVARHLADGTPDASFDGDGFALTPTGRNWNYLQDVMIADNGDIVAVGNASYSYDGLIIRYDAATGATVPGFATSELDERPVFFAGGASVALDRDVRVFDKDLVDVTSWAGTWLSIERTGAPDAADEFSAGGGLAPLTEGGALVLDGTTIGTVTTNSGGTLRLDFTTNATNARIDDVLEAIRYRNDAEVAGAVVALDWTFSDGNTGAQGAGGEGFATGSIDVTFAGNVVTVNSTKDAADAWPGDGRCWTGTVNSEGDPECTLRAAIAEANAHAAIDTVHFAIPTSDGGYDTGIWTTSPATPLPAIAGTVEIDGSTQPGWVSRPIVSLDGALVPGDIGLEITADDVEITALQIGRFGQGIATAGARTVIKLNHIGVNPAGDFSARNNAEGVRIDGPDAVIDDNNISYNGSAGILVNSTGDRTRIINNDVGIRSNGTFAEPNRRGGIEVDGAADVTIGEPGAGNVISGNEDAGIIVAGAASTGGAVQANLIGVGPDGTTPMPNAAGIAFRSPSTGWLIGGTGPGEGNVIAHNTATGVSFRSDLGIADDISVIGNTIHSNTGLAIDLTTGAAATDGDGVTANDAGDGDTGANDLLNFPVITAASVAGGQVDVDIDLDVPAGTYLIELYANPSGADPSGHGEAEVSLDAFTVTHTGSGVESFTHTFGGHAVEIAATATEDLGSGTYGSTSELSATFSPAGQDTLTVNSSGDAADVAIGNGQCDTGATNAQGDPECTLRAAIAEANAVAVIENVHFAIPTADAGHTAGLPGFWTIAPATELPAISDTIDIDARTQPGWAGTAPVVELDGGAIGGTTADGLTVWGSVTGARIAGLAIVAFPDDGFTISGNQVMITQNHIGMRTDGVTSAGNGSEGVVVQGTATDTEISDNVISGQSSAAAIVLGNDSIGTVVTGNLIGTAADGTTIIGNQGGIWSNTAGTAVVGGLAPGDGNTIAGSTSDAITFVGTGTVSVVGNSIAGNGGLAIDLDDDGVTPNDAGDTDAGPNDLLNFPELRHAREVAGVVTVDVDLDVPAGDYLLEIFANPSGADPTGYGEAQAFLYRQPVTHTGSGPETFTLAFNGSLGDVLTATATEYGGAVLRATSELSLAATVTDGSASIVNSSGDAPDAVPGDTRCDTGTLNSEGLPECTLRAAIEEANGSLVVDRIDFAIPTSDPGNDVAGNATIAVGSALPTISAAVTVDATTQAGWAAPTGPVVLIDGSALSGAEHGLQITGPNVTVRGIAIGGFPGDGIRVASTADEFTLESSWLGLDLTGTSALGNAGAGVWINDGADQAVVGGAGVGNTISGNAFGVVVSGDDAQLLGNIIGLDANGAVSIPNAIHGITVNPTATGTRVGGSAPGDGNLVTGNFGHGIRIENSATVLGNRIGVSLDGSVIIGNGDDGIRVIGDGNVIGGSAPGEGNLVSGSPTHGINVIAGASDNRIEGNEIRTNNLAGVRIGNGPGDANAIVGNAISDSGLLGIDIDTGGPGVSLNDSPDVDGAPNFPEITSVQRVAGDLIVELDLDAAAGDHRIEVFANTAADPSGYGEGETLVHAETVTHTGSGVETFTLTFPSGPAILAATATADLGSGTLGATSEFSAAVPSPDLVVVNSTGDADDTATGDGQCDTGATITGGAPECTLRAAITEANDPTTPVDTIWFSVPTTDAGHSGGVWTITPATVELAALTDTVTIDGSTQPGWATDPIVVLDGTALAGDRDGLTIDIGADDTTVGHLAIVSFPGDGMRANADRVRIHDMFIGVLPDGVTAAGNATEGIIVTGNDVQIRDNVIGAHGNAAVALNDVSSGTIVAGNVIGTDRTGTVDLGNLQGIWSDTTGGGIVGGTDPADANVIANSSFIGVEIRTPGSAVTVIGNEIRDNAELGIDLVDGTENAAGVTANDSGDGDTGPNGLLNHPVLTASALTGSVVDLTYTLDVPAGTYRVEFYANPGGADPSGHGEGEQFLGAATITHLGGGSRTFTQSVAGSVGSVITATVTEDLGGGTYGATSEFSSNTTVTDPTADRVLDESVRRSDLDGRGGIDTSLVPGIAGNAVTLTGGTERLVGPALDITDTALTMAGWVEISTMGTDPRLVSRTDGAGQALAELLVDSATGEAVARLRVGGSVVDARGGSVGTRAWHHLAAVWDGAEIVLYVDGVEVDRVAAVGSLATDLTAPIVVGNTRTGANGLNGSVDNVQILHRAETADAIATHVANVTDRSGFVAFGREQTGAARAWTVSSAQIRSGGYAAAAPQVDGPGETAWLTALGLDEPGMVFRSWWWVSSTTLDIAAGTRTGAVATDQYETASSVDGFNLARRTGASVTQDAARAGSPDTGRWVQVEIWTDQNGDSRVLVDGTEVIGWTPQGSALPSGSVGLRAGGVPAGEAWYVDDTRGRRLITPEPITTLGPLDRD